MTQTRKPSTLTTHVTLFVLGLLLGLLAAAGVSHLSHQLAGTTSGPVSHPHVQTAMHQIELPPTEFLDLVYGVGTEYDPVQAERLGQVARAVCAPLWDGMPYLEIRDALADTYGWSKGEAGLFLSAAQHTVCRVQVG